VQLKLWLPTILIYGDLLHWLWVALWVILVWDRVSMCITSTPLSSKIRVAPNEGNLIKLSRVKN